MKTEATFTGASWDFTTIWGIFTTLNDGYPILTPVYVIRGPIDALTRITGMRIIYKRTYDERQTIYRDNLYLGGLTPHTPIEELVIPAETIPELPPDDGDTPDPTGGGGGGGGGGTYNPPGSSPTTPSPTKTTTPEVKKDWSLMGVNPDEGTFGRALPISKRRLLGLE